MHIRRRAWAAFAVALAVTAGVLVPVLSWKGGRPAASADAATSANRISVNGKSVYLNGVNVPWGDFGRDIGCNYDADRFESMFGRLEENGVNSARFWLHIDARCSPVAGSDNVVTGVPASFYANLDDFLDRARAHDVAVLLTLWSFDMTKTTSDYIAARGNRTSLVTDPAKTAAYVDKVLVPMAKRYDNHTGLLGYEIINEPEWSVTEVKDNDQVSLAQMQRFIAQQVVALQKNTGKLVNAAGSAMLKWHSDVLPGAEGNWWSDAALAAQVGADDKPYAVSDFNQVHWYDWGKGSGYDFSPWQRDAADLIGDGKPLIVGEFSARGDAVYSTAQMVGNSWNTGLAGAMPWSFDGVDSNGSFADADEHLKALRDAHPNDIDVELGTAASGPSTAATPAPTNTGASAKVGQVVNRGSSKCLDVTDGDTSDGTPAQIWTCFGGNAHQSWQTAADDSLRALGKCLDVQGRSTSDGAAVQLWTCHGAANQIWRATANGELVNPGSGRCLTVVGNATVDGARLELRTCEATPAQTWTLPS